MDNLEKIKRHLAKPVSIVLKNVNGDEDTFEFKPLNIEQQAILMEISNRMQSRKKVKLDGVEVPEVNKEDMKEMYDLILDITNKSIVGLDEETLADFVNTNFDQISDKLVDLMPKRQENKAIDKLKKKMEDQKNARRPEVK